MLASPTCSGVLLLLEQNLSSLPKPVVRRHLPLSIFARDILIMLVVCVFLETAMFLCKSTNEKIHTEGRGHTLLFI